MDDIDLTGYIQQDTERMHINCLLSGRTRPWFWITDPGHAWLAVPGATVAALGMVPTEHSLIATIPVPRKGKDRPKPEDLFLLLEEDLDAPFFVRLAFPKAKDINEAIVMMKNKTQGYRLDSKGVHSWVRDLPSFSDLREDWIAALKIDQPEAEIFESGIAAFMSLKGRMDTAAAEEPRNRAIAASGGDWIGPSDADGGL